MSGTIVEADGLRNEIVEMATRARQSGIQLGLVDTEKKNALLKAMAAGIESQADAIIAANRLDVEAAVRAGRSKALVDRLTLTTERVKAMADGLREIAALPDPIGEMIREWNRPNGILIRQVRVPLGVVAMIYESRPNVTAESAGLCLKSGNAVVLRGGSESFNSNRILVDIIGDALRRESVATHAVQLLPPHDRRSITILTQLNGLVDLVIARGSEKMIKEVSAQATVPVMGHGKGVCHVYVDKSADIEKAVNIAFNSKVQRPGVCNAMETLLVHEHLLYDMLPKITERYVKAGVEIRGDERVVGLVPSARPASAEDWNAEYLDKIVAIRIVDNLQDAINHINAYGSRHTDSIVTEDRAAADLFERSVDSACVMVNASTRLHDGGVFGFGSEIGISTNKLHARGTMGLRELTTTKYLVEGNGQIRE